jgi:hypothetical protein
LKFLNFVGFTIESNIFVIYLESSGADLVGKELGVGMTTELN